MAVYLSVEDLNKAPPCNPNPTDVGVTSMIVSQLQSEHFSFNTIVDFSGLALNIFLNISIIVDYTLYEVSRIRSITQWKSEIDKNQI